MQVGSRPGREALMLDDDTNMARWLMNLSTFVADVYLKHPRMEMQGLLQHIFNRLARDSFAELHILRDLLSTMGGIKYDVTTVSQEDVDSRSGGERLRLLVEYPWPTESLFNRFEAEGEMGMGKEGGAKQVFTMHIYVQALGKSMDKESGPKQACSFCTFMPTVRTRVCLLM